MKDTPYRIVALPGEGVGPEVVAAALRVLDRLSELHSFSIEVEHGLIGEGALSAYGVALPQETLERCRKADAILFGAVARHGILELRKAFDFYVNLRPVRVIPQLADRSSLRREVVEGVDLLFVRELSSGIYFGRSGRGCDEHGEYGFHTMHYYDQEIRRVARHALDYARARTGRLTVVHKENALPRIKWQELVRDEAASFPEVEVRGMLVDTLAMELVRRPREFDVILAGNLFGDILSDIGGAIAGSLGMLPSASLNDSGFGLYEPVHGTAPDIAGKNLANPFGMLGSVEMMLQQWGLHAASRSLRNAQELAITDGLATADIAGSGGRVIGTEEMAEAVAERLEGAGPGGLADKHDHTSCVTAVGSRS